MILKRTLPLLTIVLFLTGCFRQAEDTFDTVGSQNSGEITITQAGDANSTATTEITIIDPNATEFDAESAGEASPTPRTITSNPTTASTNEPAPTNTSLAIPTASEAVASATPVVLPTATEPTFITPEVNQQVVEASSTPAVQADAPTLEPTPTGVVSTVALGECDYEVQSGDNLFRIALDNSLSLDALLSANGLTQASVIQPGQVLTLPNCDGESIAADAEPAAEITEEPLILDDCDYEIQTGDTLFNIGLEFGVTLAEILEENNLTEDDFIQPGQIIRLPDCVDGDTDAFDTQSAEATEEADAIDSDAAGAESDETIHVVVAGDTLLSVARQYSVTVNDILQANTIPDPNNLTAGQQLVIP